MNLAELVTSPWAIEPAKLCEILDIYATHLRGEKIDIDAIEARLGRPLTNEQREYVVRDDGVAVLSIEGVIAPKANLFTRISGGASAQMLTTQLESAIVDDRVRALVLAIDSPGGSVFGTPELAATVRELSSVKPIVAVSDGMMASGAYWVGSAADRVLVSGPTVMVGSIGVVATHTFAPSWRGSKVTEITAGKYKRIATENAPLTEEGREYMQSQVDHMYAVFVDAVAGHRGVSTDQVLARMADGRVFVGQQAIDAGLVDGFGTVDAVAAQLAADPFRFRNQRAGMPERSASATTTTLKGPQPMATDADSLRAQARRNWDAEPSLRNEFSSFENYASFFAADARGLVRVLGKSSAARHADTRGPGSRTNADSLREQAQINWAADASLRNEFSSFESYASFFAADARGLVQIAGQSRVSGRRP